MIPRDGEREFVVSPSGEGDSVSPPPPKGGTTNQETFLKAILRSGLLTREQLDAALRGLSQEVRADPRALANHLIRTGRLSSYQASKLLKGAALGLILGPFQVLAPIGKGGMSTVYLARDARSGQLVALKVLPPKKARRQERLLARFRREMEISRRVAHPNLAWTYEVGVEQGVYYIAMEFIPGKSLYRLVAEQGPLEARRAARLFVEVCSALAHAHEQGLIHRDLKPSNIMVTPNDHAKVLDLGLALVQGESSADRQVVGGAGYVVGSMDYIAPEQTTDSSRVDARSDVYGLGCSLYYTLSGRPPFPGGTTLEKIQCHRSEEPTWLGTLNRSVPPELAQLVHRMMAKPCWPGRPRQPCRWTVRAIRLTSVPSPTCKTSRCRRPSGLSTGWRWRRKRRRSRSVARP